MPRRLKLLLFAFIVFVDTGCGRRESRDEPGSRAVETEMLAKYPVSVDVFRRSADRPALGGFRPEYVEVLVPESALPESERARLARRRFEKLARLEFAVTSLEGIPYRVNLVSVGATVPDGNSRIDIVARTTRLEAEDGPSEPVSIPFPWLKEMTWGLRMQDGNFIQSTPYYAELGAPTSRAGIRQSLPDAMALYSEAQKNPAAVRVHVAGSNEASERLRELAPLVWIVENLDAAQLRLAEAINLLGPEVRLLGHGWVDPLTNELLPAIWPKCGIFDCFKSWRIKRPANEYRQLSEIT